MTDEATPVDNAELLEENALLQEAKDELAVKLAVTLEELEKKELANQVLEENLNETVTALEDAEDKVQEFKPTADVTMFLMASPEEVYARFGKEHLVDLANMERVKLNRERTKNGHFPLPQLEDDELDKALEAAIADLLLDRERATPPLEGPLNRVLKMVDKQGGLRQIPYEPQINNMAGSLADGYERYRLKGFKMPEPMLCAAMNCYLLAAVNEEGKYLFRSYCTADHERRTERDQQAAGVPGITNRNVLQT